MSYAIATFCYGERYYKQTNNLIESIRILENQKIPEIYVVTDNPDYITKQDFVKVEHVKNYDESYCEYKTNYYDFDFSVKRFSLLFAFQNGYKNVILTDTDVYPNYSLYNYESIMNTFVENSVGGQVTYNFTDEQKTFSMLGDRFKYYEKSFDIEFDKMLLNEMVEDCIQFISINEDKKFKFIDTWNKCINIKKTESLPNTPAGNIDEMCFAALYNNINVVNTSGKSLNLLVANHDKWY